MSMGRISNRLRTINPETKTPFSHQTAKLSIIGYLTCGGWERMGPIQGDWYHSVFENHDAAAADPSRFHLRFPFFSDLLATIVLTS
jgi:hypothetical protein